MLKQQLKRLAPYAFYLLILLFFVLYLRGIDLHKLERLHVNWYYVGIGTLFALAFRYGGVFVWRVILRALGSHKLPPYLLMSYIYAKAWMGRYIPGTVPWIASKIYMAGNHGISKSRLTVAALLEGGMQVVAITIVALLMLGFDPRLHVIPLALRILLVIGALALLVFLSPPVFNRLFAIAYRLLKRGEPHHELRINAQATVRSFLLYAVGGIISGLSYFFITKSIEPHTSWSLLIYIIGIFNLASAIGIATPLVPSGLGVRDGIQLILLAPIFPREIALAITVFSRLWSAAVDVLFFVIAAAIHRLTKSPDGPEPTLPPART